MVEYYAYTNISIYLKEEMIFFINGNPPKEGWVKLVVKNFEEMVMKYTNFS